MAIAYSAVSVLASTSVRPSTCIDGQSRKVYSDVDGAELR